MHWKQVSSVVETSALVHSHKHTNRALRAIRNTNWGQASVHPIKGDRRRGIYADVCMHLPNPKPRVCLQQVRYCTIPAAAAATATASKPDRDCVLVRAQNGCFVCQARMLIEHKSY